MTAAAFQHLSHSQQVAVSMISILTGALSLLGSATIIFLLLVQRSRIENVKYRFLFGLCLSDVLNSLWYIVWSTTLPEGSIWGAWGNRATCNAQGFFLDLGLIGPFYNGGLCLYYYQSITKKLSNKEIAKKYEWITHFLAFTWNVGTGVAALALDLYTVCGIGCWISPEPLFCERQTSVECTNNENAYVFAWVFNGMPLTFLAIFIFYCMVQIYKTIKAAYKRAEICSIHSFSEQDEQPAERTETGRPQSLQRRNARMYYADKIHDAGVQCFLYVLVYFVTHAWAFVVVIIEQSGSRNPFAILFLNQFFWPLQGFCNVFVFLRPGIQSLRTQDPNLSYWRAAYKATFDKQEESAVVQR